MFSKRLHKLKQRLLLKMTKTPIISIKSLFISSRDSLYLFIFYVYTSLSRQLYSGTLFYKMYSQKFILIVLFKKHPNKTKLQN